MSIPSARFILHANVHEEHPISLILEPLFLLSTALITRGHCHRHCKRQDCSSLNGARLRYRMATALVRGL